MKLEELLNTLVQRGWKPYGYQTIERVKMVWTLWIMFITKDNEEFPWFNIRMLTSKESLLWQFVCKNWMARKDRFTRMIAPDPLGEDQYNYKDYRYWVIESALCDEDKLEEFLLQNIKLD